MSKKWGFLYSANVFSCQPRLIRCPENITLFHKKLVKEIDMVPYGDCRLVWFGSGNKGGITAVQLIETSSIVSHFCEETNDFYFDLFSCKPYNQKVVDALIREYFKPKNITGHYLERQAHSELE